MGARVLVVRHGDTALNDKGYHDSHKIRGWKNIPLDDDGREQAVKLGKALEHFPIAAVYCSDLDRALDTGDAIAARHAVRPEETKSLRPWHLGDLQGEPVKKAIPLIVKFTENEDEVVPGGESFRTYRLRFLGELVRLCDKARKHKVTICIVTHSRGMQATRAWIAAGCPNDLTISTEHMNSYEDELPTASAIELTPDGACWKAAVVAKEGERTGPTS